MVQPQDLVFSDAGFVFSIWSIVIFSSEMVTLFYEVTNKSYFSVFIHLEYIIFSSDF
jgi:hypothetical protein